MFEMGLDKGIKKGKSEGIKLGEINGIKKGKIEGEKETKIKTAKKMIKDNMDINLIIKYSGLSKKEIEKLLKQG